MRANSICQCTNCGSCARSQLNAERTSGSDASRATSCCTLGCDSDTSAREPIAMAVMGHLTTCGTELEVLAWTEVCTQLRTANEIVVLRMEIQLDQFRRFLG